MDMSDYSYGYQILEQVITTTNSELIIFFVIVVVAALPFYGFTYKNQKRREAHEILKEEQALARETENQKNSLEHQKMLMEVVKNNTEATSTLNAGLVTGLANLSQAMTHVNSRMDSMKIDSAAQVERISRVEGKIDHIALELGRISGGKFASI